MNLHSLASCGARHQELGWHQEGCLSLDCAAQIVQEGVDFVGFRPAGGMSIAGHVVEGGREHATRVGQRADLDSHVVQASSAEGAEELSTN